MVTRVRDERLAWLAVQPTLRRRSRHLTPFGVLGVAILITLVAGLAINTFAPTRVADPHALQILGEIGVAFLMFSHGAEFSRGELRQLAGRSAPAGILQIVVTIALAAALSPVLELSPAEGVYLGGVLSLSSAAVEIVSVSSPNCPTHASSCL